MPVYRIKLNIPIALPLLCSNSLVIIVEYKGGITPIEMPNSASVRAMRTRETECVTANKMMLQAAITLLPINKVCSPIFACILLNRNVPAIVLSASASK